MRQIDIAYRDGPRSVLFRRVLAVAFFFSGGAYLTWRLGTFSLEAPVASAVFYAAESAGFLATLLLFFVTGSKRTRAVQPAPAGLKVDVLIPTYNEDLAVVRRTVVAALRIHYPHETWLLDDGNRPEFSALARELGCRYLARQVNTGAKAGNLNNALRHADGDFLALFDADHCAEPHFLDRLLGYFSEPTVAFVQTPQDYYNLGSFQHGGDRDAQLIWHEQSGFHHIEQPARDFHNAATLCGCSCVLRREHLDLIGGFPEETVTEDMHAAVRLQKRGLSSVYHDEPLAYGVAAPDLHGFATQRLRWGEGNMQVCRAEGVPFARELTWRQNLCYLLLSTVYVDAWRKLILYLAPPLTVLMQIPPVLGDPLGFALFFVPYFFIGLAAYYAHYGSFGRIVATEVFALARLTPGLMATGGLFRKKIKFRVASKRLFGRLPLLHLVPAASILVLSLWAVADVVLRVANLRVVHSSWIPVWIECCLALLCAYHAALALRVLRIAQLSSRVSETNYEHPIVLPIVWFDSRGEEQVGWTQRLSIDRAVLQKGSAKHRPIDIKDAIIVVPGKQLKMKILAGEKSPEGQAVLSLHWPNQSSCDDLDQVLHAGRWHRVAAGRAEMQAPWWLRTPPAKRAAVAWQPLLMTMGGGSSMLGYVREIKNAAGEHQSELIVFGEVAATSFQVKACPGGRLTGAILRCISGATEPLIDEGALEALQGHRVLVEIVRPPMTAAVPLRTRDQGDEISAQSLSRWAS